jgi:branched-chain amino acid transport system permease protein
VIAILTFLVFTWFFQKTPLGLAMRATAENQVLAESVGLQVRLMLAIAWALVAVMAAMAGIVQGTGGTGLSAIVIPFLAFLVFPAVLLGGIESITGALVGGLIIGIVERLTALYISSTVAQEAAPFVVLIIVLIIRPDGLFGQRRIERV